MELRGRVSLLNVKRETLHPRLVVQGYLQSYSGGFESFLVYADVVLRTLGGNFPERELDININTLRNFRELSMRTLGGNFPERELDININTLRNFRELSMRAFKVRTVSVNARLYEGRCARYPS
ncbi:hypothetical protein QE152_g15448 [Popillia japonica]|uniref:Uncharacterized protein n=1 Tax=Popillia japonica TaxID=7064 RepID=A0AAW1L8I9_POPJA